MLGDFELSVVPRYNSFFWRIAIVMEMVLGSGPVGLEGFVAGMIDALDYLASVDPIMSSVFECWGYICCPCFIPFLLE